MMKWGEVNSRGRREYRLHPGQSAVMLSIARFTFALAGTGGGKSVTGPLWMMKQIKRVVESLRDLASDPFLGLVLAPTKQILTRATLRVFLKTFAGTDLEGVYRKGSNGEPPRYILPRGIGTIFFLSGYIPNNIEGDQYDCVWADEGAQLNRDTWVAIQGRTGMRQAPVLVTSTIYHLHWIKKEAIRRFREKDPDYNVVSWSSILNPLYPVEEYERAKRTLPPALFGMRYDGVIPETDSLVFSSFDFEENVKPCEYDPARPMLVGCNFSVNPLSWVLAQPGPNGMIEVVGELILKDATTQGGLDQLYAAWGTHPGVWRFYGDSTCRAKQTTAAWSDYALIQADFRFRHRSIYAPLSPLNPVDRIASTNSRLFTPRGECKVLIDPRCTGLIEDLETRLREEDSRDPRNERGEAASSGAVSDALSFIVHHVNPIGAIANGPVLIGVSK